MSRCFPYPPPGYVRDGASGDALIEVIKLQREKAKTENRKEKKREKKDRRKEKKETRKEKKGKEEKPVDTGDSKTNNSDKRYYQEDKHGADSIQGYHPNKCKDGTEQLEKSDLTEEHEQPIYSQNPCYLSDISQSSNKRKRDAPHHSGSQNHGNVFKIQLTLKKHKEPNASSNRGSLCSTSGRADPLIQQKYEVVSVPDEKMYCSPNVRPRIVADGGTKLDKGLPSSVSVKKEMCAQASAPTTTGITFRENEMQLPETCHQTLIEDWVPPLLQIEQNDSGDQDWLFGMMRRDTKSKKLKVSSDGFLRCGSPSLWPRAQYLAEVDVYALPYTIPF